MRKKIKKPQPIEKAMLTKGFWSDGAGTRMKGKSRVYKKRKAAIKILDKAGSRGKKTFRPTPKV
jgi:hypothetical protein